MVSDDIADRFGRITQDTFAGATGGIMVASLGDIETSTAYLLLFASAIMVIINPLVVERIIEYVG